MTRMLEIGHWNVLAHDQMGETAVTTVPCPSALVTESLPRILATLAHVDEAPVLAQCAPA
jgi:hypothetical protein